jgi:murein DD-endopeptidase MepM/ murein hydrolase activator NlpD
MVGVAALVAAAAGVVVAGDLANAGSPPDAGAQQTSTELSAAGESLAPGSTTVLPGDTPTADIRPVDSRTEVARQITRTNRISRSSTRASLVPDRQSQLDRLAENRAERRNSALTVLEKMAQRRADEIALDRWVLPTSNYHITATFGEVSGLWSSVHTGLDFATSTGTPIVAVASGTVTSAGYDGAYGNKVELKLDDGTVTWYCHMTEYSVSVGEHVLQGQQLGTVGSTGNTTGPHLHFEVHPDGGDPVDPYPFLVDHGVTP